MALTISFLCEVMSALATSMAKLRLVAWICARPRARTREQRGRDGEHFGFTEQFTNYYATCLSKCRGVL